MNMTLRERIKRLPSRLLLAMGCYLVLIAVGLYVLLPVQSREDRFLLGIFLTVFIILILKTIVHANKGT